MQAVALKSDPKGARVRTKRPLEYYLYFTILFVLAIPFGTVDWIRQLTRRRTLNLRGPLARAWAEADRVTPLIFAR